jgi:hypothetical protein
VLTVRTRDGEALVEKVLTNRGGPERSLTVEELATKFRDNARRALKEDSVALIEDVIGRLDALSSVAEVLVPAGEAK